METLVLAALVVAVAVLYFTKASKGAVAIVEKDVAFIWKRVHPPSAGATQAKAPAAPPPPALKS